MTELHRTPLDRDLARELAAWRSAAAASADALALARLVTRKVRRVGRHALPPPVLDALAEIADRHRGREPFLDAYLEAVLAGDRDLLALGLLRRILDDPGSGLDPERLAALLLADVVRHERRPGRTDPAVRRRRVRQASRFVWTVDRSLPNDAAPPPTPAGDWFELTVLPTSTGHDEYVLIRALQAHRLVLALVTARLRAATAAARSGRPGEASALLARVPALLDRASLLLRLAATGRAPVVRTGARTDAVGALEAAA